MFHSDLIGDNLHIARSNSGIGSPVGVVTPGIVGEFWFDIAAGQLWTADGLTNTSWVPVGSSALKFTPVLGDRYNVTGRTPANVVANFTEWFNNRHSGTWDTLYKYLWWTFFCPQTGNRDPAPQRFASRADLAAHIGTLTGMSGGMYDGMVHVVAYDIEDSTDMYPQIRHSRNSMLASMLPWGRWLRRSDSDRHGVCWKFNNGLYYLNWLNDLARQFVIWYTANRTATPQIPPTNEDECIWYSEGKRGGFYNWLGPEARFSYQKPIAWDMVAGAWVAPAPGGDWRKERPFVLYEQNRSRILAIEDPIHPQLQTTLRDSTMTMVFPVINSLQYLGFMVYPYGVDTWMTEWLDPTTYEMTLRVVYRHEFSDRYVVVPSYSDDGQEHSMFSAFANGSSNVFFTHNSPGSSGHVDDNSLPSHVMMARRDLVTGVRSPWRRLVALRRRIPFAPWRMDPSFRNDK
jgi:hypothetical protein